jgi:hypothetical protein
VTQISDGYDFFASVRDGVSIQHAFSLTNLVLVVVLVVKSKAPYYHLSCSGLITSQLKALTQKHMPDFNSALLLQREYKLIRNVTILVPSCTHDMKKNVFYVTLSVYPQQAG